MTNGGFAQETSVKDISTKGNGRWVPDRIDSVLMFKLVSAGRNGS
jgi:hypothetical protein